MFLWPRQLGSPASKKHVCHIAFVFNRAMSVLFECLFGNAKELLDVKHREAVSAAVQFGSQSSEMWRPQNSPKQSKILWRFKIQ